MKSNRRAFTLIEMLFAIILIAAFFVVAERVMRTVIMGFDQVPRANDAIMIRESMLQTLRHDAWGARAIEAKAGAASITNESGNSTWSIDGVDVIRTTSDGLVTRWQEAGADVVFEADPVGLKLSPKDTIPITVVSQLLLEKARPR